MVSIPACHAGGRGSIPRRGDFFEQCPESQPRIRYSGPGSTCLNAAGKFVDTIDGRHCRQQHEWSVVSKRRLIGNNDFIALTLLVLRFEKKNSLTLFHDRL